MLKVVSGIVINPNKKILVAECLPGPDKTGYWEFPGGKSEPNESSYETLQRELEEEIGIKVTQAIFWKTIEYKYPSKHVVLDLWFVHQYKGEVASLIGQKLDWVEAQNLHQVNFLPGNLQIIENLKTALSECRVDKA